MLRSAASKAMWVGRTAAAVFGLALVLALVLGVATMALAAVPGDPFKLGQANRINDAVTTLIGSRSGAIMAIDNDSTANNARALDLRVEPNSAPMAVNSDRRVTNLNADQLDNLDSSALMRASTYKAESFVTDNSTDSPNNTTSVLVKCDPGDKVLSGGYSGLEPNEGTVTQEIPTETTDTQGNKEAWKVLWQNGTESESGVLVIALCADFPPTHTS